VPSPSVWFTNWVSCI